MTDDSFQREAGDQRLLYWLELHDQQVRPVRVGDVLLIGREGWLRIIGWTPTDPAGPGHHPGHPIRYVAEHAEDQPLTLHARGHYTLGAIPPTESAPA